LWALAMVTPTLPTCLQRKVCSDLMRASRIAVADETGRGRARVPLLPCSLSSLACRLLNLSLASS
jgi:hypothetical protein